LWIEGAKTQMKTIQLDILAHADFSGRIRQTRDLPGLSRFAYEINQIRHKNPDGTLLLDAGDQFCCNYWGGVPVAKAQNLICTDAMCLGNHEFDWGEEFLQEAVQAAEFPVLCANIIEKDTHQYVTGVKPWVILEKAGVKIGILGLTTEYTPYMVTASYFAPYQVADTVNISIQMIADMKQAGAELIVVLSHFPFYIDKDGISGELPKIMAKLPKTDVFVGGHIPGDYADVYQDTVVLKAGFGGKSLAHARLLLDPQTKTIVKRECTIIPVGVKGQRDTTALEYEQKVTNPFSDFFETKLAELDERWELHLSEECKLGNFLADAMRKSGNTDIAYMNATCGGGALEPGAVTKQDIVEVTGFNDPIYTGIMTGKQIHELFELVYVPERYGNNAGLLFSGLCVTIDHTQPAFHKIKKITLPDGRMIQDKQSYTVATSEYMSSGGNDTGQIANQIQWHNTNLRFHDVLFDYAKKQGKLKVDPQTRLIETGTPQNNHAPF
jgi:2',3'-cyclic-nucleotide 2'-phosphodiesterase/3'-nucleotidase